MLLEELRGGDEEELHSCTPCPTEMLTLPAFHYCQVTNCSVAELERKDEEERDVWTEKFRSRREPPGVLIAETYTERAWAWERLW